MQRYNNFLEYARDFAILLKIYTKICVYKKKVVHLQSQFVHMEQEIRHIGIVLSVTGEQARVQIVQTSACAACKAKEMCTSAESQEKVLEVQMLEPLQPGDRVEVMVRERLAWKAVLLGYILPFVVMMVVLFVLNLTTALDEAVVGTLALCSIAVYYLVLRLFRNKLQREFSFTARKE